MRAKSPPVSDRWLAGPRIPSISSRQSGSGKTMPTRPTTRSTRQSGGILGFTLIELMIVVVVAALLLLIAYPSYEQYQRRAVRSAAQQWLLDFSQRQEQFFLDRRAYATTIGTAPGELNMQPAPEVFGTPPGAGPYQWPPRIVLAAGPPPGYTIDIQPVGGGRMAGDGGLALDAAGQRWRDVNCNGSFEPGTDVPFDTRAVTGAAC
jgi:type IV pilus assembly protein PilE